MCYAFNKIERNDKTERHATETKAATARAGAKENYCSPMKMRWIVDKFFSCAVALMFVRVPFESIEMAPVIM